MNASKDIQVNNQIVIIMWTELVADYRCECFQGIQVNNQIVVIILWTDLVADHRCECFPGNSGK